MSLRTELLQMAKSDILGLTVIHVTNEMEEAMMVADRIAIINNGKLEQVGTPYEIYYQPKNFFVANFLSEINYFEGTCAKGSNPGWDIHKKSKKGDKFFVEIQEKLVPIPIDVKSHELFAAYVKKELYNELKDGEKILLVVRANHMKIKMGDKTREKHTAVLGKIVRRKFMGVFYRFEIEVRFNGEKKTLIVTKPATSQMHKTYQVGSEVTVYYPKELCVIFKHPGKDVIDEVLKLK